MNRLIRAARSRGRRDADAGQVLVIVAAGMLVIIAMVGLVIDGGYAWGRQRETQNGADASSKSGAVVILQWLSGESKDTDDVACAVKAAADKDRVELEEVVFTTFDGTPMGTIPDCGTSAGGIPTDAQGVKVTATQQFDPFIMQALGFGEMEARANATAVVGPLAGTGAVLPVTFPQTVGLCDGSDEVYSVRDWNDPNVSEPNAPPDRPDIWDPYEILPSGNTPDASNLAIVPLCTTQPGSVGWLEFGCGNLAETISQDCDVFFTIPDWIQTQTGNVNSLDDELAEYHGAQPGVWESESSPSVANPDRKVTLPIHRTTCGTDAGVNDSDGDGDPDALNACPGGEWTAGTGNNTFYGVEFWVGFVLDEAHVGGNDSECRQPAGQPQLDSPTGFVGCLKGWFVDRIGQPDEVSIGDVDPGDNEELGVTLIN